MDDASLSHDRFPVWCIGIDVPPAQKDNFDYSSCMYETDRNEAAPPKLLAESRGRNRLGIVLIILSGVFWFSIFAVPFAPLTIGQKSIVAGSLFAAVQISWWTGAALAGPRVVGTIRKWFSKKPTE